MISFIVVSKKKHISDKDYAHAKKVWNVFGMKTLGDYHDLYVQADTAQLSDVFESFRSTCLKVYNLDPAYFVSTSSLLFQAMLKVTKAEIETFTDTDMILMTEKGIRGGLTQVVKKHAVANNKYLHDYERVCFYNILMQITYMVLLCAKSYLLKAINGLISLYLMKGL